MVIEVVLLWMVAKSCTLDAFSTLEIMGCLQVYLRFQLVRDFAGPSTVGCGGAPEGPEVALSVTFLADDCCHGNAIHE